MSERQTGRTAQQMRDAPRGAVYVWCDSRLGYPRALAKGLGREDLRIVPLQALRQGEVHGSERRVVCDHAVPGLNRSGAPPHLDGKPSPF